MSNRVLIALILLCFSVFSSGITSAQVSPVITLTGYVFNEQNFQPLDDVLIIVKPEKSSIKEWTSKTHSGGYYLITGLQPGEKYTLRLRKAGFFETEYEIHMPNTRKYTELSRDFLMKPLRIGQRLLLHVPPFSYKKAKLKLGAEEILDDIVKLLLINPSVHIRIETYPDTPDDTTFNRQLTEQRAKVLEAYLLQHGIERERIEIKSYATIDPLNPPPIKKRAKGKYYIGPVYIVVTKI